MLNVYNQSKLIAQYCLIRLRWLLTKPDFNSGKTVGYIHEKLAIIIIS